MEAKAIMARFYAEAKAKGYSVKIIGAYAFRTPRRKKGKYGFIRLTSGKPYKVYEGWMN